MNDKNYKQSPEDAARDLVTAEKLLHKMNKDLKEFDCAIRLDILASLMDSVFMEIKAVLTKAEYKDTVKQILKHLREVNK